jgi:hypothetical protein
VADEGIAIIRDVIGERRDRWQSFAVSDTVI